MRTEIDSDDVKLDPTNETDSQLDRDLATLVFALLAARRSRDCEAESLILRQLDCEYGVKLVFADEIINKKKEAINEQ